MKPDNKSPEWYPEEMEQFDPVPDLKITFGMVVQIATLIFTFVAGYLAGRVETSQWFKFLGR